MPRGSSPAAPKPWTCSQPQAACWRSPCSQIATSRLSPARPATATRSAPRTWLNLPTTLTSLPRSKRARASIASREVGPGQAVAIMTGAPVPNGADAVVMVEYTARDATRSRSQRAPLQEKTSFRAARKHKRASLLDRGMRLNEAAIALAASVGKSTLVSTNVPESRC